MEVAWDDIDCYQQNSNISGYSVTYYMTSEGKIMVLNVSSQQRAAVVNGLYPLTNYAFQVAAFNNNRSGPHSVAKSTDTGFPTSNNCDLHILKY